MKDNVRGFKKIPAGRLRRRPVLRLCLVACLMFLLMASSFAQSEPVTTPTAKTYPSSGAGAAPRNYPKEIRGYKVARVKVDIRKSANPRDTEGEESSTDSDALIHFGEPRIISTTPLGITLEVPVTIAAVKQGGRVDFLAFEDMVVNGMPVTIEDYMHPFELPNKEPMTLPRPVRLFISSTRAIVGAINDWSNPQPTWPVTGRVYVFGHYRKFIFTAKRVVPVEISLTMSNPLRNQKPEQKISDPAIKQ